MNRLPALLIAAVGVLFGAPVAAQDLSSYRDYALESSFEAVLAASGARAEDARILHQRPARIQELAWRAPYVFAEGAIVDPVEHIVFSFVDGRLYQVVVKYARGRTDGLTNSDIVESLAATYGVPLTARPASRIAPGVGVPVNTIGVARWETGTSSLALLRDEYSPEFRLVLMSKSLSTRARDSIREATRLDAIEAPRRDLERRRKEVVDADAARQKARTTNKAAFRP